MQEHIQNEALSLYVDPIGAELGALYTHHGPEQGYLWGGDPTVWPRRAPVCFPWCGRLKDDCFEEGNRRYPAGAHGFVRDFPHALVNRGTDFLTCRLDWPGDEVTWPWRFSFETCHRLVGGAVVTTCTAVNQDTRAMPVQLGFHTGLRCPITPGRGVTDYFLRFEVAESPRRVVCAGGLVTGEELPIFTGQSTIPLEPHMFDGDSIALKGLKSRWVQLEETGSGKFLRLALGDAPYVLLWSGVSIPGFLCIEPWQGLPSRRDGGHTLWERPGMRALEPGQACSATQTLTVSVT